MNLNRNNNDQAHPDAPLAEFLAATVRYIPLLNALLALGILVVYWLALGRILGHPEWQLLAVGGATLAVGLAHLAVAELARSGRARAAYVLHAALLNGWALSLVILWESAWPIAILIAWATPLAGSPGRSSRYRLLAATGASLASTLLILWLDANPLLVRAVTSNTATLASLVLVGSTVVLFVIGTFILRLIPYRSV